MKEAIYRCYKLMIFLSRPLNLLRKRLSFAIAHSFVKPMRESFTKTSFIYEFIEDSAEAIFILDNTFKIMFWNGQCEALLKITRDAALNKLVGEVVPEFGNDYFQLLASQAMESKATVGRMQLSLVRNSNILYLTPSFSPIRLTAAVGCMIILRETNVPDSMSMFMPLIKESPIATAIYHPDGTPKYLNKAFGHLWGVDSQTVDEVIKSYNIFEDEQLVELGIMPFIQRGFAGETVEIPSISYCPFEKSSVRKNGLYERKYVKGYIFSMKNYLEEVEDVFLMLFDITFQKQAEGILTDTHLKFQMLTKGLPGVIYEFEETLNGQSRFRYISQGCSKMFGISPDKIMQDASLLDTVIHPWDLESFKMSEIKSRKYKTEWQWEGRILVDGKEKWIEGKSSPSRQQDGRVIRYGLLMDITDKKEVEEQYRLSEERLQLALQGAELGLWEWDLNDRKTIFNKGWAAKFGYDSHELELQFEDWDKLIHPDDLPAVKKKINKLLNGKSLYYEAEYRLRSKNGEYRWILDKGGVMERNGVGKVMKASGTYLDVNEKKSSELLIQRNQQLFTQLFENSPLGIVLLNEKHEVIQMNQGFKNIFGFTKKEVLGNKLNNILVPDDYREEAININELARSGKVTMLESKRKHKNGSLIPVIIYGVPVTFDSKTIGIYGIYVDITDRTKAETELQVRNNELDNFVYKVSHDLRAPLSSILGLINLVHHKENNDDPLVYMDLIENRVKQLDNFINDVLSHSKNLKLAITIDPIDLDQIIERCFTGLSYLPKAEKIKKQISITGESFYSDKWRINEIFRNLISNAIKYLNPTIDNPFVYIDIVVTEKAATIIFKDNGIGIEKKTLPKVFEMFYRATEYSEGSGIGLYIVNNAIQKLGGKIRIQSKPNIGTTFNITIPNHQDEYANSLE